MVKAFGGLWEVLHWMENKKLRAHSNPMPNGYGTVKSPHFLGQPGLVIFGAVSMFVGVMELWVAARSTVLQETERSSHGIRINMFVIQNFQRL